MTKERKVTTLRIEPDLYKEVAKIAADEGRSTNEQILRMLKDAVMGRKAS